MKTLTIISLIIFVSTIAAWENIQQNAQTNITCSELSWRMYGTSGSKGVLPFPAVVEQSWKEAIYEVLDHTHLTVLCVKVVGERYGKLPNFVWKWMFEVAIPPCHRFKGKLIFARERWWFWEWIVFTFKRGKLYINIPGRRKKRIWKWKHPPLGIKVQSTNGKIKFHQVTERKKCQIIQPCSYDDLMLVHKNDTVAISSPESSNETVKIMVKSHCDPSDREEWPSFHFPPMSNWHQLLIQSTNVNISVRINGVYFLEKEWKYPEFGGKCHPEWFAMFLNNSLVSINCQSLPLSYKLVPTMAPVVLEDTLGPESTLSKDTYNNTTNINNIPNGNPISSRLISLRRRPRVTDRTPKTPMCNQYRYNQDLPSLPVKLPVALDQAWETSLYQLLDKFGKPLLCLNISTMEHFDLPHWKYNWTLHVGDKLCKNFNSNGIIFDTISWGWQWMVLSVDTENTLYINVPGQNKTTISQLNNTVTHVRLKKTLLKAKFHHVKLYNNCQAIIPCTFDDCILVNIADSTFIYSPGNGTNTKVMVRNNCDPGDWGEWPTITYSSEPGWVNLQVNISQHHTQISINGIAYHEKTWKKPQFGKHCSSDRYAFFIDNGYVSVNCEPSQSILTNITIVKTLILKNNESLENKEITASLTITPSNYSLNIYNLPNAVILINSYKESLNSSGNTSTLDITTTQPTITERPINSYLPIDNNNENITISNSTGNSNIENIEVRNSTLTNKLIINTNNSYNIETGISNENVSNSLLGPILSITPTIATINSLDTLISSNLSSSLYPEEISITNKSSLVPALSEDPVNLNTSDIQINNDISDTNSSMEDYFDIINSSGLINNNNENNTTTDSFLLLSNKTENNSINVSIPSRLLDNKNMENATRFPLYNTIESIKNIGLENNSVHINSTVESITISENNKNSVNFISEINNNTDIEFDTNSDNRDGNNKESNGCLYNDSDDYCETAKEEYEDSDEVSDDDSDEDNECLISLLLFSFHH